MHLLTRGDALMCDRPDSSFHNPYEYDAEYCDVCGAEMYEDEDEEGRMLPFCPECP